VVLRSAAIKSVVDIIKHIKNLWIKPPLWFVSLLLLVWTCLVRLPFAHIINDDEAFFSVVADRWRLGEWPYVASYDVKPPGLFAIFALVQAVFGSSLMVIKGIEIAFTGLCAFSLYIMLARQGFRAAGLWAGGLMPVYSLTLTGTSLAASLIQLGLTAAAFAAMLEVGREDNKNRAWMTAALSGVLIGSAIMVKQTAAFEALGLAAWITWQAWRGKRLWPALAFYTAAALPTLGFAALFFSAGYFSEAFQAVVVAALDRGKINMSSVETSSKLYILQRMAEMTATFKPLLVIFGGSILALLRFPGLRNALKSPLLDLTLIWLFCALAGILSITSISVSYSFPVVAPFLVLFAIVVCHGIQFPEPNRRKALSLIAVLALAIPLVADWKKLTISDLNGAQDFDMNAKAAQSLIDLGVVPKDHILVLSRGHFIYLMTSTLPKARYFNAMHLFCAFPTPSENPLQEALSTQPQYMLMSTTDAVMSCQTRESTEFALAYLQAHYDLKDVIRGKWDGIMIYKLKTVSVSHKTSK
jgi:4-amino-4-deoxy-L-arabinose transferase-like glycosyltransferase